MKKKNVSNEHNSTIDIITIYNSVITELNYHNQYIDEYKKEYDLLTTKKPINYKERQEIEHKIIWLDKKIKLSVNEYENKVKPIIDKYKLLQKKPITISFIKTKKNENSNNEINELISDFITITNNYSDQIKHYINHIPINNQTKRICKYCDSSNIFQNKDINTICLDCAHESEPIHNIQDISYDDGERVNMTVKFKYSRLAHFEDTISQFQGNQNKTIPLKVYLDLEREFDIQNLLNKNISNYPKVPIGKEFHNIIDKDITLRKNIFNRVSREHILNILSETNNSKFYEDINLLHKYYNINNFKNNISHLIDVLLEDFIKILDIYERVHSEMKLNRINFLNSNYILFQLLRKHNYQCQKEDFMFLKTIDRIIEHDEIYSKICEYLEWTFTPTI